MSRAPAAGLKRAGLRSYLLAGASDMLVIEKDSPRCWWVRPRHYPPYGFFAMRFNSLGDARSYAENRLGIDEIPFPDPDMPVFLRRYKPRRAKRHG